MIPTGRLVALFALPLAVSALLPWLPAAWPAVALLDVVVLLVALSDALLTRAKLTVSRELTHVQAVGRAFEVVLEICNVGRRAVLLRVVDDAPGEVTGLSDTAFVASGGVWRAAYQLTVGGRGAHVFGPVTVRWMSPLGLFERQQRFAVEDTLRVYPDFAQLRTYGLTAPSSERRVPVRARRRAGGETEFERLRPYVAGDPYRHIDWRATARRREFVTREFGQESNQNVIFLLDCGRLMTSQGGSLTAFDHALNAAVIMGQAALRHGDRVGLLAFDDQIRVWLPPKGGKRSGGRLIRSTYDLFPSVRDPDYALAFRHLHARVRRRSLVVLLTHVSDEVNGQLAEQLVGALRGRHIPLAVWLRDAEIEELISDPEEDPFTKGAAAELANYREQSLATMRRRGVLTLDVTPGELTPQLVGKYLEVKARGLL